MSTRCVVTFKDDFGTSSVYKHYDGFPSEIMGLIEKAKQFAWPLPRFEADEFAAAFVVAAKMEQGAGNVRLSKGTSDHGDLSYSYTVTCVNGELVIKHKRYE